MSRLVLFLALLALTACGTTSKAPVKAGLDFVPYKSLSSDRKTKAGNCPHTQKSWSKSNNKTVLDLANSCLKAKKWKMLSYLGEHLALELPYKPWGAYYMSLAAEGQGQLSRALWMAKLSVKKAPKLNILHFHKGRVEWALGDGNAAIKSMNSALALDRQFEAANFFLANIHFQDQDYKSAKKYFEMVLKKDASHSQALVGLGESHYRLGSKANAQKYYELAIDSNPSNLPLRLKLADLYESEKDYKQALHHYKKAKSYRGRGPASLKSTDISLKIRELEKEVLKMEQPEHKTDVSQAKNKMKGGA